MFLESSNRRPMRVDFPSSTLPAVEKRSRVLPASSSRKEGIGAFILKIPFPFLGFHGSFLIMINDAGGPFGNADGHHLLNDFRQRGCSGSDGSGARVTAQSTETAHHLFRLFAGP